MKIQVTHKDGRQEVLSVVGPLNLIEGDPLSRIVDATGLEHWFNEDGTYNGWGRAFPDGISEQRAVSAIEAVESTREFIEPERKED